MKINIKTNSFAVTKRKAYKRDKINHMNFSKTDTMYPVPYLSKFCAFNLDRNTAKNDVLACSRALAKRLMFSSSSAA